MFIYQLYFPATRVYTKIVGTRFRGKIDGLCGNANGNSEDDYGQFATTAEDFGDSHKVESSCPDTEKPEDPCDVSYIIDIVRYFLNSVNQ